MLRDGEYAAWFRTALGSGTGRVLFKDGKISGSDSIISYTGSYAIDGDRFAVTLVTRRHTDDPRFKVRETADWKMHAADLEVSR